ncbi:hypothetical protein [Catelliglobosispora koreensis]|uniref:hypothetical protein n=1 Tax=Catelliglobosispora koreensis TaxID=129052 RepID=UPI0012F727E4|nr:hypothetical protein [Catelliglobosispora koreensis]
MTPSRLTIAVMVAVSLVVGVVTGVVAAKIGEPPPKGPALPLAVAAGFPTAGRAYLPGVTVSLITQDWLGKAAWTCDVPEPAGYLNAAQQRTLCVAPALSPMSVTVLHDGSKVRSVSASCRHPLGSTICTTLYSAAAELVFTTIPEHRASAAGWAAGNATLDANTTIGGIRLITDLSARHIRFVAAE